MATSTYKVKALVNEIRMRWRRRALIQGAAVTLLTLVFVASLLLLLRVVFDASPAVMIGALVVGGIVLVGVLVQLIVRPTLQKISDQQIALYVEEKIPTLEDRLNSAVEIDDATLRKEHDMLLDRLIDDAMSKARAISLTTVVDRKKEKILTYSAAAFFVVFLIFGASSLDQLTFSIAGASLSSSVAVQPYMTVAPGTVEIEKGESQEVIVELRDDTDDEVVLSYRLGEGEWQQATMQKGLDKPRFLFELFNIQEPVQYFAEHEDTRSDLFTISLYEFPNVEQIDLTYSFPDYTGLAPRVEENTGDIRGLKGSTVAVSVATTGTVETATLVFDDGEEMPLRATEDGHFRGSLALEEHRFYQVRLTDVQAKNNKFPEEYQITPIDDEPPFISITDPLQDVRANAIEEVLVAVSVEDDYGVKDTRLKFSVNGEDEQSIPLMEGAEARPTTLDGEHLFFLEDFGLEPGDIISYYVEAEDYFHTGMPEASDMYFIEVIPFDQRFSQANNAGGGQAGGQQPSGMVLNQQQIISATWKLRREADEMDPVDVEESRKALVQAQTNLKDNIEERINSTAFSLELRMDEDNQKIVEYLRQSTDEMEDAIVELQRGDFQEALTPERKAYNFLLRADALNKERQVALNRGQQQGGGGGGATEERMSELMDLELDISKDKYEVQQQQSQQQQQQQEVDDALRRIQELARKQQNLANQSRQGELEGEDKKRNIEQLKRDQDELRQQTEQLANSMRQMAQGNEQISREMEQSLERVAENMREAEEALRNEDQQRAMARQQQALNELNRLQQQLQMANNDNTREALEDLTQSFDQFRDQEQQLARDLEEAAAEQRARSGGIDEEELERLQEKRQNMIDNLARLESQADAVQEGIQQEDPEMAQTLRNILQDVRREGLEENMERSARALEEGWLDYAERVEEEIQNTIERLETQRRALDQNLPVTEEERLARSLEDVRDLMRQLEEMQARSQQQQQAQNGQQQAQNGQQNNQNQNAGQNGQNPNRQQQADAARMQRQLERMQETVDRLQQEFGGNPTAQRQLQQLQQSLRRADHTGVLLEDETAEDFFNEQVYDPLSQLEMDLTRELDLIEMEKKLFGGRRVDVPTEYQDMVEKYYEALAKTRGQQ